MAKSHKRSLQQELRVVLEKTLTQSSPDIFQKALDLRKKLQKKAVRFTDSAKLLTEEVGSSSVDKKETRQKTPCRKGHPPQSCPCSPEENAEKIHEIKVKQIDRLSNSIRNSSRPEGSKAITQKWDVYLKGRGISDPAFYSLTWKLLSNSLKDFVRISSIFIRNCVTNCVFTNAFKNASFLQTKFRRLT